jgi:hypothetical protein
MNEVAFRCPKCQGEMVEGMVATEYSWYSVVQLWAGMKDWADSLKAAESGWFAVDRAAAAREVLLHKGFLVRVFRCSGCGYLESYARQKLGSEKGSGTDDRRAGGN